jgi:hypothetical protein
MGLFDQLLNAVNDPGQQASQDQLSGLLNTVQQLGGNNGIDPAIVNSALSIVGGQVRSSLQNERANGGGDQVQSLVNQFAGMGSNPQAVNALFSSGQVQGIVQAIAQRTGLDPNMVQGMLPTLVPLVLNMLQGGNSVQGSQGGNAVLNTFLDADNDGDVDVADVMQMAGRYLR